ncbi:hypothetical protein [Nocardioides sp.]|uniref:hypothetical protein n=1 Tax=Nocardioides sp. TaxID=35761 RepID=UPI002ED0DE2C
MNPDLIGRTLTEHATAVDHRGPDLGELHARIAGVQRRRQGLAAVTASAALVVGLTIGTQLLGGSDGPQPAPGPTLPTGPSGTGLPFRPDQTEFLVPDSAREDASRIHLVERHQNQPGSPLLEVDVNIDEDRVANTYFCEGAEPGLWLVVRTPGGGGQVSPCDGTRDLSWTRTLAFNRYFARNTSNLTPRTQHHLKIFVTTADGRTAGRRELAEGMPAETDARFGVSISGQTSPTVATLVGREVSVLGEGFDGRDWWFTRGVEAATGAESLVVEIPASEADQFVQVVRGPEAFDRAAEPDLRLDGEHVPWPPERTPYLAFLDDPCTVVPAGAPHTVEVRLPPEPRGANWAVAVFEAGEQ